ncbi:MAG TPA: hypothetical protein VHF51_11605 [Solirubrobacteraceae bacterium]|nr:hypothetical protein [Solirubrobacteraceae bacterium]
MPTVVAAAPVPSGVEVTDTAPVKGAVLTRGSISGSETSEGSVTVGAELLVSLGDGAVVDCPGLSSAGLAFQSVLLADARSVLLGTAGSLTGALCWLVEAGAGAELGTVLLVGVWSALGAIALADVGSVLGAVESLELADVGPVVRVAGCAAVVLLFWAPLVRDAGSVLGLCGCFDPASAWLGVEVVVWSGAGSTLLVLGWLAWTGAGSVFGAVVWGGAGALLLAVGGSGLAAAVFTFGAVLWADAWSVPLALG